MYKSLVFAIFVLLCDIRVIISKPASEQQQELELVRSDDYLTVEGLPVPLMNSFEEVTKSSEPFESEVQVPTRTANFIIPYSNLEDGDTKKHYYLFKIREYYNFLPLYRDRSDTYSGLEIIDKGDMEDSSEVNLHKRVLSKRDVSDFLRNINRESFISVYKRDLESKKSDIRDETLKDTMNVLQTMFLKRKRGISNKRIKRDLGNFLSDKISYSADTDDAANNNKFKYIAYVPFFRVRKYFIHRKRLDVHSY